MSSTIAKIFIAALAAGAVNALPQNGSPDYKAVPTTMVTVASSAPTAPAPPPAATPDNTALIERLESAPTNVDRFKRLLTGADGKLLQGADLQSKVVFDFNNAARVGNGGATKAANIASFPILTELGISVTMGFLDACGINTPHTHPRATEFLTVVDGELETGFVLENGFTSEVTATVGKNQGTVFPMGSIHYQFNAKCEPVTFVAALNSEDPGTSQIAQNFFALDSDIVQAATGLPAVIDGKNFEEFKKAIPANVAKGVEQCLRTCYPKGGY